MSEATGQEQAQMEMPRYQSHKKVRALKIKGIVFDSDGSAMITPENTTFSPFWVSREYVTKHQPQAGGYFVVYKDGYKSYSPAEAFESGYTVINT